jgi:type I restriction enzyme M protein
MRDSNDNITLQEIEQYLSKAAWILKGPVDAADFKAYIFPLLFFKRISDVYDEEYLQALQESGNDVEYASLPEFHRFIIPEDCHWNEVRGTTVNVGQRIQYAFREIEKANQDTLYGIFSDTQWTNKEKLSDELLLDLIEHFSSHNLSNSNVNPDMLGEAYEYIIKQFADLTNKKAGEFYTPRSVVGLMTMILNPTENDKIYDPAAGTGGMLLNAVEHLRSQGKDARTIRLFGQEKNLTTSSIARMNMFLHNIEDFQILRGDTLREPLFFDGDSIAKFDCVLANPPFSLENWGQKIWESDPYGRNKFGVPNDSNGDYAWVEHMISSMNPYTGRMAVVLPHGVLFRKGKEHLIRKAIIEHDLLDAVIGLAPNIFYGTPLAPCILVFRAKKTNKGKILFIDASDKVKVGRAQNYLLPEHVDMIYEWYRLAQDVQDSVKLVDLKQISENNFNLNIPLYIEKKVIDNSLSLPEAREVVSTAYTEFKDAEKEFIDQLKSFGISS